MHLYWEVCALVFKLIFKTQAAYMLGVEFVCYRACLSIPICSCCCESLAWDRRTCHCTQDVGKVCSKVSLSMTAACTSTGCRQLHSQWATRRTSEGHSSWKEPLQHPLESLLCSTSMGSSMRQDLTWGEEICLTASVCGSGSEFPARLFAELICQWELY